VVGIILIVEDEPEIAVLLALNLEAEGFVCHHVDRGDVAVAAAIEHRPDGIILDVDLPGANGIDVCRALRRDPRFVTTSVIIVSGRASVRDRIVGLDAGADDYMAKPFDIDELVARVRSSLHRAEQLRATSPLTGLPSNFEIEHRLDALVAAGEPFALLHADIDDFKSFNDHYGFLRGDRAIILTGRIITKSVDEVARSDAFVGHIGGDDFAVVCPPQVADLIAERIIKYFDEQAPLLYAPEDVERGMITVADRMGQVHQHPIITLSIGVASSDCRSFASASEAAAVAVEMKLFAKQTTGSTWRRDRRRA
jgi:diguanylate cyclase (GGDEF)-like protein